MKKTVLILGASDKPERYAYKAFKMLKAKDYPMVLVNPQLMSLEGHEVASNLGSLIPGSVDTVTLYVGPKILLSQVDDLKKLKPRRVIFNPGTEDLTAESELNKVGIHTMNACTLVLLSTNQFESA